MNRSHTFSARDAQSLRNAVEHFQSIIENSLDVISEVTATGELLYVSPSVVRVLGYTPGELEGGSIFEIIHPEDIPMTQEQFTLPEGSVTCRCRHKDGSWRWLETSGRDFVAGDGGTRGVLVARDVTERIKAAEERAQLEAQLRHAQKLEVLGTLASGIAHDFNNILTVLLAHAELAGMDAGCPDRVQRSMAEIRSGCDRARDLTRRILAFSRKQASERKPVHLQSLVKEVFTLLRSTLPATIKMDFHLDSTAPVVLADSTQIHQVLLNLCVNAQHAMHGMHGQLIIRLDACVFDGRLPYPRELRPGCYARMSISDTGRGMSEDVLEKIFAPFFTTKPPGEGNGIGLAVVQGIVKEHDGAITVRSRPGEGTTFELYFPAHSSAQPSTRSAGIPISGDARPQ